MNDWLIDWPSENDWWTKLSNCLTGRPTYDWLTELIGWTIYWLAGWLTGWLSDWVTDQLTDWLTDWLSGWLYSWLTDWLSDWLIDWLADWLTDWLTDCLAGWLAGWLTGWLAGWYTIDWLAGWLTDCLTDWSIDQLYCYMSFLRVYNDAFCDNNNFFHYFALDQIKLLPIFGPLKVQIILKFILQSI